MNYKYYIKNSKDEFLYPSTNVLKYVWGTDVEQALNRDTFQSARNVATIVALRLESTVFIVGNDNSRVGVTCTPIPDVDKIS
jgi:hypothetical protein